jgi:hypothetical protein
MSYDIRQTNIIVNCPIFRTEEAMMGQDEMMGEGEMMDEDEAMMDESEAMMDEGEDTMAGEAPANLPATGGVKTGLPLGAIAAAIGLLLAGAGVALRYTLLQKR